MSLWEQTSFTSDEPSSDTHRSSHLVVYLQIVQRKTQLTHGGSFIFLFYIDTNLYLEVIPFKKFLGSHVP